MLFFTFSSSNATEIIKSLFRFQFHTSDIFLSFFCFSSSLSLSTSNSIFNASSTMIICNQFKWLNINFGKMAGFSSIHANFSPYFYIHCISKVKMVDVLSQFGFNVSFNFNSLWNMSFVRQCECECAYTPPSNNATAEL